MRSNLSHNHLFNISKYISICEITGLQLSVWTQLTEKYTEVPPPHLMKSVFTMRLTSDTLTHTHTVAQVCLHADTVFITQEWCKHLLTVLTVNTLSAERSESIRRHAACRVFLSSGGKEATNVKPLVFWNGVSPLSWGVFITEFQIRVNNFTLTPVVVNSSCCVIV